MRRFDRVATVSYPELEDDWRSEHAALTAIHGHFRSLEDGRFGTVRPLALLEEHRAFAMDEVSQPTLRDVLEDPQRYEEADLLASLRHAGAWLAEFHSLAPIQRERPVLCHRSELVGSLEDSVARLRRVGLGGKLGDHGASILHSAAVIPLEFAAVRQHSDFAPHNVFAGPRGKVTIFDTRANECGPPTRDLAHFVQQLRATLGRRELWRRPTEEPRIAKLEQTFLEGYASTVERGALRLFEAEVWLRKWSRAVESVGRAKRAFRLAKWTRMRIRTRMFVEAVDRIARELEAVRTDADSVDRSVSVGSR